MIGHLPRNALIGFAVLLWATLAAAWLVPPMLDWNRYRTDIAGLISRELGEELAIAGQVHIVLLPQPLLVVDDVALTDVTDHLTMRARELRLQVAFWPLLAGRVETQEMVLRGFSLEADWPLGPLAGRMHPPSWLASFAARIEDGTLRIGAATLSHLDATLRLLPDSGGMSLAGGVEVAGFPWRIAAHLTPQGGDGAAGFDTALEGMNRVGGANATFSGQLTADGALRGHLGLRGPDLAQLATAPLALPAGPFKAEADLDLRGETAALQEIAFDFGSLALRGSATISGSSPRLVTTKLAAAKLDLDAWLPSLLQLDAVPGGFAANVDLSAEAATLADGVLHQMHAAADISSAETTLRDVSATLPGAAKLAVSGILHHGAVPHLDGKVALDAPALRDTLAWLSSAGVVDTSRLPTPVLHSANLRAGIGLDVAKKPTIALSDLNGMIDVSHVQGSATLRPGARLGIVAALDIDRLGLDEVLPHDLALAGAPARFGRTDLDLNLHIQRATLAGQTISPLQIDAATDVGHVALRRVEASLPGGRLLLSGQLAADGVISEGRLDVATNPDAIDEFAGFLPGFVVTHLPRQPLALSVQAEGPPNALGLHATLELGDLHARAAPLLDLTARTWHGSWALRHPGAYRLLEEAGWPDTRAWLGEGSLSASGALSGTGLPWAPTSLHSDGFDLAVGQLRASTVLDVSLGDTPGITGRVTADMLPLPLPALRSSDPLRLEALAGWTAAIKLSASEVQGDLQPMLQQASANLSLNAGMLKLDDLSARLSGGMLSGRVAFDSAAMPPLASADMQIAAATPSEKLFDLPLDIVGGSVDGALHLTASGFSPAALLSTLEGQIQLSWHEGALDGVDLGRMGTKLEDADLRVALLDGSTAFQQADIAADVQNGALRFTASSFKGPSGRVDLNGLVDLVGRNEELRLVLVPAVPSPPNLALTLSGKVDAPTRNADISDAARWRAQFAPPPAPPAPTPPPASAPGLTPSPPAPQAAPGQAGSASSAGKGAGAVSQPGKPGTPGSSPTLPAGAAPTTPAKPKPPITGPIPPATPPASAPR